MKRYLLALCLMPALAFSAPFDMLFSQKNIADTATLPRTASLQMLDTPQLMGIDRFTNLPAIIALSQPFDIQNGVLMVSIRWDQVLNAPVLSPVATSGNYNDLINKPSLSQVNADWQASSGPAQILNRPAFSSVAVSGAYADLSGTPTLSTVATTGAYGSLSGVPSTFTPSAHTHAATDIVSGTLSAARLPTLAISQTAGLQTSLDAKFATPSGTTSQYVRGDGSLATLPVVPAKSQSSATRALNTAFQVSTTRDAMVQYSVQTTITASIAGGQDADVFLDIASDSGFTANVQSVDVAPCSQTYTLAVAIQGVQKCAAQVRGFVPAGYYARIRTVNNTGTPAYAYRLGQEVLQ